MLDGRWVKRQDGLCECSGRSPGSNSRGARAKLVSVCLREEQPARRPGPRGLPRMEARARARSRAGGRLSPRLAAHNWPPLPTKATKFGYTRVPMIAHFDLPKCGLNRNTVPDQRTPWFVRAIAKIPRYSPTVMASPCSPRRPCSGRRREAFRFCLARIQSTRTAVCLYAKLR